MEKEIYKIIDKEKLNIVVESIENAHGLPNECYLNGPYTNIERKKIFEDKWVAIGVASSIPNPGDTKPFDLLGIPLIMVRDKKQKVRVFHNVCSHRGYKLIHESCALKNVLRCPYHSWSYDFEGNLIATPHLGGINKHEHIDFDKSKSKLKEVQSTVWLDLIMVNISGNELPFEEMITDVQPLSNIQNVFENIDQNPDGMKVLMEKSHAIYLLGIEIDWLNGLNNRGF